MTAARAYDDAGKDEILARIGVLWKAHPELRLGQLIGNVIRSQARLYYLEDYPLIESLEASYQRPR